MHSEEELQCLKYNDLLKIAKDLGLKCGKQKTRKVIEIILQEQNKLNKDVNSSNTLVEKLDNETDKKVVNNIRSTRQQQCIFTEIEPLPLSPTAVSLKKLSSEETRPEKKIRSLKRPISTSSNDSQRSTRRRCKQQEQKIENEKSSDKMSSIVDKDSCCNTISTPTSLPNNQCQNISNNSTSFNKTIEIDSSNSIIEVNSTVEDKSTCFVEKDSSLILESCPLSTQSTKDLVAKEKVSISSSRYYETMIVSNSERRNLPKRSQTFVIDEQEHKKLPLTGNAGKRHSPVRSQTFITQNEESEKSPLTRSDTFTLSPRKRRSSPQANSLDQEMVIDEENKKSPLIRSDTFTLSPRKRKHSPQANVLDQEMVIVEESKKSPLRRSDTFTISSRKRRNSPQANSFDQEMDLSCNEVQTIKDIQSLENISCPSVSDKSSLESSPLLLRKSGRKSLRGQILESQATNKYLENLAQRVDSKNSTEKKVTEIEVRNNNNEDAVQVPMAFEVPVEAKEKKASSAIPRFVPQSRSLKKMPNFAKIHEKAFNKMENIVEYMDRKKVASTQKKFVKSSGKSGSKPVSKQLLYSQTEPKQHSSALRALPKTLNPSAKKSLVDKFAKSATGASKIADQNAKKSVIPRLVKENLPPRNRKSGTLPSDAVESLPYGSLLRRKSYKPDFSLNKSTVSPVSVNRRSNALRENVRVKKGSRVEKFKKIAQKKHRTMEESRQSRVNYVKGVRSNRRFELMMLNRKVDL